MAAIHNMMLAGGVPALTVNVSPTSVSGTGGGGFETVTTNAATATPTGGVSPYTYAWDAPISNPTSATSASTQFSASMSPGESISETGTCTVTDAAGQVASDTVEISMSNF